MSTLYRPKLTPPSSEVCPIPMEKTAIGSWGGPASTFLPQMVLSMPDGRWKLQANQTWHQRHICPALWNSYHVAVSTVKVNYILTCRLKFPHLFFIAQISSDKTEPNFYYWLLPVFWTDPLFTMRLHVKTCYPKEIPFLLILLSTDGDKSISSDLPQKKESLFEFQQPKAL